MDPLSEPSRLVERLLDVAPQLLEEARRRSRVGARQGLRELELDRERDDALLHTFVQLALETAPVEVGRVDEPLPRRAQLLDLGTQPLERRAKRLALGVRHALLSRP